MCAAASHDRGTCSRCSPEGAVHRVPLERRGAGIEIDPEWREASAGKPTWRLLGCRSRAAPVSVKLDKEFQGGS